METTLSPVNGMPIQVPDERLCALCHGMKYLASPLNIKPGDRGFGRAIPCECNRSDNIMRLRKMSNIKGADQEWSLRSGSFKGFMKDIIKELIATVYSDEPAGFWYFHGPNGVGKSYVLKAAVNEANRQQRSGLYMRTEDLLKLLRESFSDDAEITEKDLLRRCNDTTVLSLDEFGREHSTSYSVSKLTTLLDDRYMAATNYGFGLRPKLTLFAGNLPLEELDDYLVSRLRDRGSRIVDMSTLPDRRGRG